MMHPSKILDLEHKQHYLLYRKEECKETFRDLLKYVDFYDALRDLSAVAYCSEHTRQHLGYIVAKCKQLATVKREIISLVFS